MIIISDKNIENSVYFPRNLYAGTEDEYTLVLNDRGSNTKHTFSNVEDKHLISFGFYTFIVDFTQLPKGEYEYTIFDTNENIVGTGLIRLNELTTNNVYYNNERTYVVYDRQ